MHNLSFSEFFTKSLNFFSDNYWIDPNEGCNSDAEYVYCDFERNATCVSLENKEVGSGMLEVLP